MLGLPLLSRFTPVRDIPFVFFFVFEIDLDLLKRIHSHGTRESQYQRVDHCRAILCDRDFGDDLKSRGDAEVDVLQFA